MIDRSTDIRSALKSRQRGFFTLPGGMGAARPGGSSGANFANVKLLLHMDGTDGSTTFTDSSSNGYTVTANGNAQIDTAQSKYGGASGLFDGSGDYLSVGTGDIDFGTGDFTIEAWVRFNSTGGDMGLFAGAGNGSFDVAFIGGEFRIGRVNIAWDNGFAFTRSTGVWYHVAVCRDSGTMRAFIDGVQPELPESNSQTYNTAGSVAYVGASTTGDRFFDGWIDDMRVTAEAVYTSNFTPPAAAHPDS